MVVSGNDDNDETMLGSIDSFVLGGKFFAVIMNSKLFFKTKKLLTLCLLVITRFIIMYVKTMV